MNRELQKRIMILEAKVSQFEEAFHDLSGYVEDMESKAMEANTELSRQMNIAIREMDNKFKEMDRRLSRHVREYTVDMEEIESVISSKDAYKFGEGTKSQKGEK